MSEIVFGHPDFQSLESCSAGSDCSATLLLQSSESQSLRHKALEILQHVRSTGIGSLDAITRLLSFSFVSLVDPDWPISL